MVDSTNQTTSLNLSAQDLKNMAGWPAKLIESYLSIQENIQIITTIIDDDIVGILSSDESTSAFIVGLVGRLKKQLNDLNEQLYNNSNLNYSNALFAQPPVIGKQKRNDIFARRLGIALSRFRDDIEGIEPQSQLESAGDTAASIVRNSNDAVGPDHVLGKSRATVNGGVTIVQDDDVLGRWIAVAADGSGLDTVVGVSQFEVDDGSPAAGAIGGAWVLAVADTSGVLTEVARANSSSIVFSGTLAAALIDNTTNLLASNNTLSDGAGAGAGTLANAPSAGDPTKWVAIDDNGTTRYIPTWT